MIQLLQIICLFLLTCNWLKFNIENSSDTQLDRILEINHSLLKYVDFYFQSQKHNYQR